MEYGCTYMPAAEEHRYAHITNEIILSTCLACWEWNPAPTKSTVSCCQARDTELVGQRKGIYKVKAKPNLDCL